MILLVVFFSFSCQISLSSDVMDIFRIIGVGLLTCIVSTLIKVIKPEYFVVVIISGSMVILFMLIDSLSTIFSYFSILSSKAGIGYELFSTVLKVLGVGFLTEFASNICVDSGNASIGDKIILAGKVVIVCLAIPIITSLLGTITSLLP